LVLLVVDDENVRATTAEMLSELGYGVLKSERRWQRSGHRRKRRRDRPPFTDSVIPGALQAAELARKAQRKILGIAVLFTTGYARTPPSTAHDARVGSIWSWKPNTRDQHARKLRQILNKE
jgi:DNA-binding NtrC family response regulator